ncbi:MAG: PAS domain S-box protein [Desulfuromonadales bacterium]|nr:MAG: PAS domain S-box protein [Desulfuromonadales bacterium]
MNLSRRLLWFILARVVVVSLILASTTILSMRGTGLLGEDAQRGITAIIVATYGFSILSLLVLRMAREYSQTLTYAQIIWDILFVTGLLLFTGGIASPFSFLYLLAITNASVLLARREALYTASVCVIVYGAIIDLQYYGRLSSLGLSPQAALQQGTGYLFYTIFINILAFYLTALLTGYLAERAKRSETELEKKAIDYEELERLNSAIVSNLTSGLLTATNEGKIRVFNRYAEALTGISQEEAYDRDLGDVLPGFRLYGSDLCTARRSEFEFIPKSGRKLIIGFNSVPLTDKGGERVGLLINFQDLTQIRRMEKNLKRADRLAAIGELSARIAHEIRNPLAAISGSAQLIAQGEAVPESDRRLFGIVLRETERLNLLIHDFLAYARPSQPVRQPVNLHSLLGEIMALVTTDSRFATVRIENQIDPAILPEIDPDQFRQVLWNLLVNAAEAMRKEGVITVDAQRLDEVRPGGERRSTFKIRVEDTGPGMDGEQMAQVFEPFFTTKAGGTGLGLATVYRVVESHGGRITVESEPGTGTRFTIFLPA